MSALKNLEEKPEVSIILVNYNAKLHLQECLLSLEKNAQDTDYEVIVVDNNSSDGSQELIEKSYPQAKLIRNRENIGFARANNQGLRESKGEFVLFLNPDTVIHPKALERLLEEMKGDRLVGAVGPALLSDRNVYQISFGGRVNFLQELLRKYLLNSYLKFKLKIRQPKQEVRWLSGACLLIRKDILEDSGLFDESYFLYFEDIDLCFRIKEKGFKLIYLPQARVFHRGGASTLPKKLFSRYEYRRSQLYFYRKHNSFLSYCFLRLYLWLNFSFQFLLSYLRKDADSGYCRQFFRLLKDNKGNSKLKNKQ